VPQRADGAEGESFPELEESKYGDEEIDVEA
jgi:hypothetical protein